MSIKVIGQVDTYGDRLYLPVGTENTVNDSEFEVIVDEQRLNHRVEGNGVSWMCPGGEVAC